MQVQEQDVVVVGGRDSSDSKIDAASGFVDRLEASVVVVDEEMGIENSISIIKQSMMQEDRRIRDRDIKRRRSSGCSGNDELRR